VAHFKLGSPIFAALRSTYLASPKISQKLHPITDPQCRDPQLQDPRIGKRGARLIHALRTSGKHQADRFLLLDLLRGDIEALDLTIDALIPNPAGDELGKLTAKVQDEHFLVGARHKDLSGVYDLWELSHDRSFCSVFFSGEQIPPRRKV
jgi:hypothetical protein